MNGGGGGVAWTAEPRAGEGGAAFLLRALDFAARAHAGQRRKGKKADPYINHPIEVAMLLATVAGVTDPEVLAAAVLHDTLEDTRTRAEDLGALFGTRVLLMVKEVSDNKRFTSAVRKALQVEHAPLLTREAKLIKLADMTSNLRSVNTDPPTAWPTERKLEFVAWSEAVVNAGLRAASAELATIFDQEVARARAALAGGEENA